MKSPPQHYVEVVRSSDDAVIKRSGPMSERQADRLDDGLNINLDHDHFQRQFLPRSGRVTPAFHPTHQSR